jgi:hypothetical protein
MPGFSVWRSLLLLFSRVQEQLATIQQQLVAVQEQLEDI